MRHLRLRLGLRFDYRVGFRRVGKCRLGIGGVAVAPMASGGVALGYYANGALAWGKHALSAQVHDPLAAKFFKPGAVAFTSWLHRTSLVAIPVFLVLGFLPNLMAKLAERQRQRHLRSTPGSGR